MNKLKIVLSIFLVLNIVGCNKTPPTTQLSQAEAKLANILAEEMKLDVKVYAVGNTLYLYTPMTKGFYDFKSTPSAPPLAHEYKKIFKVNHLETRYEERTFHVDYDISLNRAYPKEDPGYTSTTSENFQVTYQKLFNAVLRSFGDLDGKEGREKGPEFIVVIMADITTGIYLKVTFHFEDYRKIVNHAVAHEEQKIRMLQEMRGNEKLIDDAEGKNIEYSEVTWGAFLAEQIKNRINVMIPQRKDLNLDVSDEVSKLTYETLSHYDFDAYDNVIFRDLRKETIESLNKEELAKYEDQLKDLKKEGRIYNLRFNYDPEGGMTIEEVGNDKQPSKESLIEENINQELTR